MAAFITIINKVGSSPQIFDLKYFSKYKLYLSINYTQYFSQCYAQLQLQFEKFGLVDFDKQVFVIDNEIEVITNLTMT